MLKTIISISEKIYTGCDVPSSLRRQNKIIIHDGLWDIGVIHNQEQLKEVLDFLECELISLDHEVNHTTTGKVKFYELSKHIRNYPKEFCSIEELSVMSKGEKLKKFKGINNCSIVDCYIGIGVNSINIYRPNINAKQVYKPIDGQFEYKRNNWYL